MAFYFEPFEHRKPPEPVPYRPGIELLWQFLAVIALVFGQQGLIAGAAHPFRAGGLR